MVTHWKMKFFTFYGFYVALLSLELYLEKQQICDLSELRYC